MAFVKKSRVRETSTTTGTGPLTLGGARSGYRAFSAAMSNGDTCWYGIVLPGTSWEVGLGTYNAGVLTRTTVYESSNGGAAVNFTPGTKDVFINLPPKSVFEPGTRLVFQQSAAPEGWTKDTTHNDKALRVVSGAASSGGTNAFSTVMAQTVVGSTTISNATMPSHDHDYLSGVPAAVFAGGGFTALGANSVVQTGLRGGGGSHNHTINFDIKYLDVICCVKD